MRCRPTVWNTCAYIQIQPADYQGPDGMKIPDGPIEHEHISRIMENLDKY